MIDKDRAFSIASDSLQKQTEAFGQQRVVLLKDRFEESEFAWVFFYDSEKHLETGDYKDALVGGGPILIDKFDGSVHSFGSAFSLEKCTHKYDELRRQGTTATSEEVQKQLRDDLLKKRP